jgi:hypothetical protein
MDMPSTMADADRQQLTDEEGNGIESPLNMSKAEREIANNWLEAVYHDNYFTSYFTGLEPELYFDPDNDIRTRFSHRSSEESQSLRKRSSDESHLNPFDKDS